MTFSAFSATKLPCSHGLLGPPTTAAWGCNSSRCLLLHSKSVTWKNSWNLNAMALNSLYYSDAKMRNCTPVIITSFKRGITNTNHREIIFLKNSRLEEIWNVTVFLLNRGLTSALWSTLKVFKKRHRNNIFIQYCDDGLVWGWFKIWDFICSWTWHEWFYYLFVLLWLCI